MRIEKYARLSVAAACVFWANPSAGEEIAENEAEQQDFLFLIEEAYTQEAGEWQVGAAFDRDFDASVSTYEFEIEYGLTDRLQIAAELPVTDAEAAFGLGDIEFGVDYAVFKDVGGRAPELTVGLAASAPSGDEDDGLSAGAWGYEASLRASKQIAHGVYGHLAGAYEWIPGGGPDADAAREWIFGAGAAWRATEAATLIAEYLREAEREEEDGAVERKTESYLSAGVVFELVEGVRIGAAGAAGLNDHSADARALVKADIEW